MAWIVISIGWKVIRWTPIFIVLPTGNGTGATWESVFRNSQRSILKHREPRVTNAEITGTSRQSVAVRIIFLVRGESRDENGIIRSLIEVVYLLLCSFSGNLLIIVCWSFFWFFFLNLVLKGRLNSLLRGKTTLSLGFGEGQEDPSEPLWQLNCLRYEKSFSGRAKKSRHVDSDQVAGKGK